MDHLPGQGERATPYSCSYSYSCSFSYSCSYSCSPYGEPRLQLYANTRVRIILSSWVKFAGPLIWTSVYAICFILPLIGITALYQVAVGQTVI